MKIFVPLTDEMLDQPGAGDRLIPYQAGLTLLSQYKCGKPEPELNPDAAPARLHSSRPVPQPCLR
jgi:hypothetical protein